MWQTIRLGDVCTISSSKRILAKEYQTEGITFYRGKEVIEKPNGNKVSTELFISPKRYEEIKGKSEVPKKGDILLTSVGTLGIPWLVDEDDFYFKDGNLTWLRCNTQILPSYLYLWLNSAEAQNQIDVKCIGSTQKALTIETLNKFQITLPSLELQKKIVAVINPIESRININRSVNENLEQQAQAIFANEFLALESLPDGWKRGSLIDIADYLNGLAMQKYRPAADEVGIPVLKIKELRQGCCDDTSEVCSPNIKTNYIIHDGDVIFSWSGSLLVDFWCGGICGLNQHLFKVTSSVYDKWFYYAWTKHHLERFIAVAADKATTMGHIKRDELSKAEVLIPNKADYNRIGSLLHPIYDLIITNRIESKKLAETRDTLLPKLMSGEIDISEVDYE